ncbi:unnamed protein product, partial [Brassica rapa subsp. trilocularis]
CTWQLSQIPDNVPGVNLEFQMVSFFHRTLGSANRKKECERERKREREKCFPTRFAGPNQCPHWSLPWRFFREQQRKKKTRKKKKKKESFRSELLESLRGRRQNHSLGKTSYPLYVNVYNQHLHMNQIEDLGFRFFRLREIRFF